MYKKTTQRLDTAFCQRVREYYAPFTAHYADYAADYYERRGQIEQALAEWRVAGRLNDEAVDSKACQALLKSVNATDEQRLAAQMEWARKHAIQGDDQPALKFEPYVAGRRITIGYVCAWWDSATIRGQALPFIALHDRSRFRLIGYSLEPCPHDVTQYFEQFRIIRQLSHSAFANLVRADKVDALVEFTGFSPHHRYAAMGARCAPVQISYMNHAGTCGVANVDYVIADDIAAPAGLDRFYTERIIRLPGTFFNFNYDWDQFPDSDSVPCLKAGVSAVSRRSMTLRSISGRSCCKLCLTRGFFFATEVLKMEPTAISSLGGLPNGASTPGGCVSSLEVTATQFFAITAQLTSASTRGPTTAATRLPNRYGRAYQSSP